MFLIRWEALGLDLISNDADCNAERIPDDR